MKKIIIVVLCLLLVAANLPLKQSSYYSHVGRRVVVLLPGEWTSVGGFVQQVESIVTLNGVTFSSKAPAWFHISGVCLAKRPPATMYTGRIAVGEEWYELGTSITNTLHIDYTVLAESFTIDLYMDGEFANAVSCTLLIEKAK